MTPEQRKNCTCPRISCKEHPTKATDRHVAQCHCIQCLPWEWRDPKPPPPPRKEKVLNRPDWLVQRTQGISDGQKWSVVYEGEHWAVVHCPGGKYWSGLGMQSYGRTTWRIMRKTKEAWSAGPLVSFARMENYRPCSHPDWKNDRQPTEFEVHEGRMRQAVLDVLKRYVHELDDRRAP